MGRIDAESETLIPTTGAGFDVAHSLCVEGFDASEDGTGRGTPLVPVPIQNATRGKSQNGLGIGGDVMFTLDQASQHAIAFGWQNSSQQGASVSTHFSPTLDKSKVPAVAFAENSRSELRLEGGDGQRAGTLSTGGGKPGQGVPMVAYPMAVRRLTPRECERLQGFPDDYTLIPWRTWQEASRKGASYEGLLHERGMTLRGPSLERCPDGPRYKALGNSMAVPVIRWIGERIAMIDMQAGLREAA